MSKTGVADILASVSIDKAFKSLGTLGEEIILLK